MNKKIHLIYIVLILMSFCFGAGSMYYYIASKTYKQYGIILDRNHDIDKFGVNTGEDYSEQNPFNYVPVDWLAKEVEVSTLTDVFKNSTMESTKSQVSHMVNMAESEGYKIYFFSSPITMWASLSGVEGYCVVDSNSMKCTKEWIIPTGIISILN